MLFTAGKKGVRTAVRVSRVVAELFIPNKDMSLDVNHKDFNRKNNCVENLEWVTHEYNVKYSRLHNAKVFKDMKGENNPNAKLSSDEVLIIRALLEKGKTVANIARIFNVGWQTVNHIKYNTTWNSI